MSIRVRETYGTSWQGTRPGTRHYRSVSVSAGLGTYLLGSLALCFSRGVLGLFLFPFVFGWWALLFSGWVLAELLLVIVTGIAVTGAVLNHEGRGADITVTWLRFGLFMFNLKGTAHE